MDKEEQFSGETIEAMKEFGQVLQRIHDRLIKEGTQIEIDKHYQSRRDETDTQKPLN